MTNEGWEDEPLKDENGQEIEHRIPIKGHYKFAGVVINKPFIHFTTKKMHISDLDDHKKLDDPNCYVSIFFTNDPCKKDKILV